MIPIIQIDFQLVVGESECVNRFFVVTSDSAEISSTVDGIETCIFQLLYNLTTYYTMRTLIYHFNSN